VADAARLLSEQPMARHGLVEFEVVPVGPFTPLSLLFGTQPCPIAPAAPSQRGRGAPTRVLALDRLRENVSVADLTPHLTEEAAEA